MTPIIKVALIKIKEIFNHLKIYSLYGYLSCLFFIFVFINFKFKFFNNYKK